MNGEADALASAITHDVAALHLLHPLLALVEFGTIAARLLACSGVRGGGGGGEGVRG